MKSDINERQIYGNSIMKPYYGFIDLGKAIAIFFVIFYHSFVIKVNIPVQSGTDFLAYVFYTISGIGVPLFFTINGFLLFGKEFESRKHMKKIRKITVLFIGWAVCILLFLSVAKGDELNPVVFFKDLMRLKIGYINHLWFMEALIYLYICFLGLKLLYDRYLEWFYILYILFILYFFVCPELNRIDLMIGKNLFEWTMSLPQIYFMYSIVYFMTGGLIRLSYPVWRIKKIHFKWGLLMGILLFEVIHVIFGLVYSMKEHTMFDNAWDSYNSICTLIVIILLMRMAVGMKIEMTWVKSIATNSFGIYLIHPVLIALTKEWIMPIAESHIIVQILCSVIYLICSLGVVLILKKIPWIKRFVEI